MDVFFTFVLIAVLSVFIIYSIVDIVRKIISYKKNKSLDNKTDINNEKEV